MSDGSLVSLRALAERPQDLDAYLARVESYIGWNGRPDPEWGVSDVLASKRIINGLVAALEAAERDRDDWREKCLAHREAFSEARAELAVTKSANVPITKLTGDAGVTTPETGSDNPQRRCAAASDTPAESVAVSEWRKASDLWQARAEVAEARLLAAQQALREIAAMHSYDTNAQGVAQDALDALDAAGRVPAQEDKP